MPPQIGFALGLRSPALTKSRIGGCRSRHLALGLSSRSILKDRVHDSDANGAIALLI